MHYKGLLFKDLPDPFRTVVDTDTSMMKSVLRIRTYNFRILSCSLLAAIFC